MERDEAVDRLPHTYAEIIRGLDRGIDLDVLATVVGVEPADVPSLVTVAKAKLARALGDDDPHVNGQRDDAPRENGQSANGARQILPSGTVTFLVVSIDPGRAAPQGIARARAHLAEIARAYRGTVLDGDDPHRVIALFPRISDAIDAAVAGQGVEPLDGDESLGVRRAIHTGESERRTGRFGGGVTRTVQLAQRARPGEIVLSRVAASLARDRLQPGLFLEPCAATADGYGPRERVFVLAPAPIH